MPFSTKDRSTVKFLTQHKQYAANKLLKMFLDKKDFDCKEIVHNRSDCF